MSNDQGSRREDEIEKAIKGPEQVRVPWLCNIPNRARREGSTVLQPQLRRLSNAGLVYRYRPKPFQESTTVSQELGTYRALVHYRPSA